MFKINLITISNPIQNSETNKYLQRLKSYCQIQIIDLPPIARKKSKVETFKTVETEILIAKALTFKYFILPLDEHGHPYSSFELAQSFAKWQQISAGITFLIGGADGLDLNLLKQKQINQSFSLSKLTLPHQMAKLILIEQIYRSFTILNHHPYHRP